MQDAFAEELKKCTDPTVTMDSEQRAWEDHKLVDLLAKELNQPSNQNAEHLSQNTTISYMVKQTNDVPNDQSVDVSCSVLQVGHITLNEWGWKVQRVSRHSC